MNATKDDFKLLLQIDSVYRPGAEAKKFAYSKELANVVKAGIFFETYGLDTDQRIYVNTVANYCDILGTVWKNDVVNEELVLEWGGVEFYWKLIGPILIQSRIVFDSPTLWKNFQALADAIADAIAEK